MFVRSTLSRPAFMAVVRTLPIKQVTPQRNMATLREIQLRLKSVSNIEKITKSMKMISSTKLTKAQRGMEVARVYGQTNNNLFTAAETVAAPNAKTLIITVSSDRGLCGGIHSTVSKASKRAISATENVEAIVLGDKAKSQVSRHAGKNMKMNFSQIGKAAPTFAEASSVVDIIQESGVAFDEAKIIYNAFRSVIAYEPVSIPAFSEEVFKSSPKYSDYEVEDDVLSNLQEFSFANNVYWAMMEGHASEMAAKRTAMENATKNAGEMINKLTLTYNRGRQAVITNELIDIITGASAL